MFSSTPTLLVSLLALSSAFSTTFAHPGKSGRSVFPNAPVYTPREKRQSSEPLIGDLATTGPKTTVGKTVANILEGNVSGQSTQSVSQLQSFLKNLKCTFLPLRLRDPCCAWVPISTQLTKDFVGSNGQCTDLARGAIRLGFHDAGAWSQVLANQGQDFGGADGSFILFNEITRIENRGLEAINAYAIKLHQQFPSVSAADLLQFMAIHATVSCPLGPRVRFFAGRKDATQAAPTGLLPSPFQSADVLVQLFEDKTISPHDLAALLGAHSTSRQFFVDTSPAALGDPQDTTPGVWDVKFYGQTLLPTTPAGTVRFPSDQVLSRDPRLNADWQLFASSQAAWDADYSTAYVRLSLLGVNVINQMTECTAILPAKKG